MKVKTQGKRKRTGWFFIIILVALLIVVVYAVKGLLFVTAIIDQTNVKGNGEFTYLRLNEDLLLIGTDNGEYRPIYSVANAYIYQLPQGLIYTYRCSDGLPREITAQGEITYVQVMDFNQKVYYQEERVC